ncbi:hypothetical protein GA0061096_2679 [Fictibacillus enclensis]|uniref:Uncharacterized protein n=1 Tax=Fictibacillus enclensis TaxID=1017270 RepID=A0A0V8J9U4_9BACL|nr:hypothetical protein [Fictibacillus enclensis]KSU83424.1 hypothetical protein AS030_12730 [Fictibacillus enclensis]SCC15248.1 hypothetical protein GA0061096_2679 [Fictibacillus enclensis]
MNYKDKVARYNKCLDIMIEINELRREYSPSIPEVIEFRKLGQDFKRSEDPNLKLLGARTIDYVRELHEMATLLHYFSPDSRAVRKQEALLNKAKSGMTVAILRIQGGELGGV